MGMIVSVFRSDYDASNGGISSRFDGMVLTNVEGPFDPGPDLPGGKLEKGPRGSVRVVPDECEGKWVMFGGCYVATSDSRFNRAVEKMLGHSFYGAVPLHDRVE